MIELSMRTSRILWIHPLGGVARAARGAAETAREEERATRKRVARMLSERKCSKDSGVSECGQVQSKNERKVEGRRRGRGEEVR